MINTSWVWGFLKSPRWEYLSPILEGADVKTGGDGPQSKDLLLLFYFPLFFLRVINTVNVVLIWLENLDAMNGDLILRLSGVKKNRVTNETSVNKRWTLCKQDYQEIHTKRALRGHQNHREKHTKTRVDGTTEPKKRIKTRVDETEIELSIFLISRYKKVTRSFF